MMDERTHPSEQNSNLNDPSGDASIDRMMRIQRVVDDCIERRLAGENLSDADLQIAHPELLPELSDELRHLAVIERARKRAGSSVGSQSDGRQLPLGDPSPPDLFPGYEILNEIQRGGQGVVYRARQSSTGRDVAIKVAIRGASATSAEIARLEQEVQVLGKLRHPGIVSIIDSGEAAGGSFYYVMDFIEGQSLDEFLTQQKQKGGMSIRDAVELVITICDAVQTAHQNGVIHRDLKPGNIRMDQEGNPHLLDFGLAKHVDMHGESDALTQVGQFVGSVPWASPEQAAGGEAQIDVRSDVYALGVIAYFILTQRFPYRIDGGSAEVLERILNQTPDPPSIHRKGMDSDLETIVLTCLKKEPDRRYQTAGELARDLRRYLQNEPIDARRDSTWYVMRKTIRRHRAAFVSILTIVALAVVSSIALAILYRGQVAAREAESHARREAETALEFMQATLGAANPSATNRRDMTVREALDNAAERLTTKFSETPRIEAAVRDTIGYTYSQLGHYDQAGEHLQTALDIRRREFGDHDVLTLRSMERMGSYLHAAEKHENAYSILHEAIQIAEETNAIDERLETKLRTSYGLVLAHLDRYQEAEIELDRAIMMAQKMDDGELLRSFALHSRGVLARIRGQLAEAEADFRETESIWQEQLGEDHQDLMGLRLNIATTLMDRGRLDEAQRLHEDTLKDFLAIYGEAHPNVLLCLNNLAAIAIRQGQARNARAYLERAIEAISQLNGDNSLQMLQAKSRLATVYQNTFELEKSLALREEVYDACVANLGPKHPQTLNEREEYGRALEAMDRPQEAESIYRDVLARRIAAQGSTHPVIAGTLSNLGSALESMGRIPEAIDAYEQAMEILRQKLQKDDRRFSGVMGMLGRAYLTNGQFAKAEMGLRECVAIRKLHYPNLWILPAAEARLGAAIAMQGRLEEGRALMITALENVESLASKPARLENEIVEWLIKACRTAGDDSCLSQWESHRKKLEGGQPERPNQEQPAQGKPTQGKPAQK